MTHEHALCDGLIFPGEHGWPDAERSYRTGYHDGAQTASGWTEFAEDVAEAAGATRERIRQAAYMGMQDGRPLFRSGHAIDTARARGRCHAIVEAGFAFDYLQSIGMDGSQIRDLALSPWLASIEQWASTEPERVDCPAEVLDCVDGTTRWLIDNLELRKHGLQAPDDPGPFPPNLLTVPGFVDRVMEHTLSTGYRRQPVLSLAASLALLSTLTGRKVADRFGTRTNLYAIGIAPTGSGKDLSRKINKEILYSADAAGLIGPEGIASQAGLIAALEEQPARLFQVDEIGRILKTLSNPGKNPYLYHVITVLMRLYTSADSAYLGDAYADTTRNPEIQQPHAVVYGTTVRGSFTEALTTESISDGLLPRILVFEAEDAPLEKLPAKPVPVEIIDEAREWAALQVGGNLANEFPEPRVIGSTDSAEATLAAFETIVEKNREQGGNTAPLWTRAAEKSRKLALLAACSRAGVSVETIEESDARWAAETVDYLTRRLVHLAEQHIGENAHERTVKRLGRFIHKRGQVTRKELISGNRWAKAKELNEYLTSLLESGEIVEKPAKPEGRGRPGLVYAPARR